MLISLEPIGYIESCYRTKFGTPRQPSIAPNSSAILKLQPQPHLQGAFEGLEGFSHIWLIFYFHLNTNKVIRAKVHPPRLGGQKMGLFASRSPHRPNPLGLSVVKLERVEAQALYLSGVDLVNGTPILDVKPYLPDVDSIPDAARGWLNQIETQQLDVIFAPEAEKVLSQIELTGEPPAFRKLICQTLSADPRPLVYRDESRGFDKEIHAVYLHNYDVHFVVHSGCAEVIKIAVAQGATFV